MREFDYEHGTHIKSNNQTKKIMMHLLVALLPIILFSFYKNGIIPYSKDLTNIYGLFKPLTIIIVAILTSLVSEYLYYKYIIKGHNPKEFMKESFGLFPGLFLALTLPLNTPLPIVIVGSAIATIIGKMIFGGFGHNIFNPALIGRLFVMSAYAINIVNAGGYLNAYEVDTISKATPLTNAFSSTAIGSYNTLVKPFGTLWDFFLGTIPGSLGETSALLILVEFIYLVVNKIIKWTIPVSYVLTVFVMTYLIGNYNGLGIWFPLFHVLSGGLLFGAVFMATDPVTSPTTIVGQILYGLFLGILTVVFRFLTPEPEGVLTSILTMNMFVYLIDKTGARSRFKFSHALIPFVLAWSLIFGLGIYISSSFKVEVPKNNNFSIVSKDVVNDTTTYIVTQKGYVSTIKGKVVIKDSNIISFEVLEQAESYYQLIENIDYINTLINGQSNLIEVDTVSGATYTSTALRTLLINTLEDYNEK